MTLNNPTSPEKRTSFGDLINFFCIFIIAIWLPFQKFVLKVDGKGLTIIALMFFLFFYYLFVHGKVLKNCMAPPILWWGLWVVFVFINAAFKGINDSLYISSYSFYYSFLMPFMVLVVFSLAFVYYPRSTRLAVTYGLLAGIFIFVLNAEFIKPLSREYERLGGDGINSNELGLYSVVAMFFCTFLYVKGDLKKGTCAILLGCCQFVVMGTASRTAFVGACLVILLTLYETIRPIRAKHVILVLLIAPFLYCGVNFFLQNSIIGERFAEDDHTSYASTAFERILGERGTYFDEGIRLFPEAPFTGIGLGNFQLKSILPGEQRCHVEYVVQFLECGIIGFVLFAAFYMSLFVPFWTKYCGNSSDRILMSGGVLLLLLLNFGAYTYNKSYFFMLSALIISYLISNNAQIRGKKHPCI